MMPEALLIELLERVGAAQDATVFVADLDLHPWPDEAVAALKAHRLIVKARPAGSAICPGCEEDCIMPVHTIAGQENDTTSFILCDKRSDANRISVLPGQLVQWRCSVESVCGFVAASLGLRRRVKQMNRAGHWEIGMVTGHKRSQMVCLKTDGILSLVVGHNAVPLVEFVDYQNGIYSLDKTMILQLVDTAATADERYTPSTLKRETRKLDTQAMYESWQKHYRKLKKERPQMSNVWISQQIAKLDIAQGREAGTIRKNMKSK